jgi:transposase-like protein
MALPQYQQRHIESWQVSGLSQAAYCREHGLNSKTFGNWLRIYRTEQLDSQASAAMIPVNIKPATPSTSAFSGIGSLAAH